MDREEAAALLHREMAGYVGRSHVDLARLIGQVQLREVVGASGVSYQIEVDVFWDHKPGGRIRLLGSIDDGGFRSSLSPLSEDLLVEPDDAA